jgi:hypothetical protein
MHQFYTFDIHTFSLLLCLKSDRLKAPRAGVPVSVAPFSVVSHVFLGFPVLPYTKFTNRVLRPSLQWAVCVGYHTTSRSACVSSSRARCRRCRWARGPALLRWKAHMARDDTKYARNCAVSMAAMRSSSV